MTTELESTETTISYNDTITRQFVWASVAFAIVGLLVGVVIAIQLSFPAANIGPYLTFGRLRPLHTNAVIFAFVGNMVFAGIYYSTQRLCRARLASDLLGAIHFWGWQAIIVAAAITLPLGYTQGKEYAELEWPIDIAIALVWVVFAVNFFWTLAKRNEKHLYVALWFYMATILTVAVLHIVNSLAIPVGPLKSYSVFGGVQDALVQWWYGHNAVAFFLTTPVLGIMYYFVPKAADRPVYSYRLSIIHFWALVFLYIWAGPHHLLYTALPDWAQSLGMVFSLMLWAPSWGGMINGLLTLRGAWDKLRTQPELKFFAAGITFYGMATFEGPLLSIKEVSALAHYTDWIVGHVHSGALGWNGFMAAGMFYYLVPKLYGTKLYSRSMANWHFWVGTAGILIYVIAMWIAGISQGLMWRAEKPGGGLVYAFLETVIAIQPMYTLRTIGGTLYLVGMILMVFNLVMTARSGKAVDGTARVVSLPAVAAEETTGGSLVFGEPVILAIAVTVLAILAAVTNEFASPIFMLVAVVTGVLGTLALLSRKTKGPTWHRVLEGRPLAFTVLVILAVLVGGVAEILPSVAMGSRERSVTAQKPYTALELEGRDVYIREGCYTCHSQMVRPMHHEFARFGAPSTTDDSIHDHPFQWGSKRTGPDLARVGIRYSPLWHYRHMISPSEMSPGSLMPSYEYLRSSKVDFSRTPSKLRGMRAVGVPYAEAELAGASDDARDQSVAIVAEMRVEDKRLTVAADSELVALIAYLQRLGRTASTFDRNAPRGSSNAVAQVATGGER